MPTFLDTSAIFAVLDQDDAMHETAEAAWRSFADNSELLVTTSYVLVETCALLQRRLGMAAVRTFNSLIAPVPRVIWVADDLHEPGMAALLTAGRRGMNLVDCVSFVAMRNAGINTAFAFDRHFIEQGFRVVPDLS